MPGEAAPLPRALPASPQLQEAPWTPCLTSRPHSHPQYTASRPRPPHQVPARRPGWVGGRGEAGLGQDPAALPERPEPGAKS